MARVETRKACFNCRERHLKCDQEQPSCRRCRVSNLQCQNRANHSFRRVTFNQSSPSPTSQSERISSLPSGQDERRDASPRRGLTARFVDQTQSVIQAHQEQRQSITDDTSDETMDEAVEITTDTQVQMQVTSATATSPSMPSPSVLRLSPSASYFFNNPPSIIGLPLATSVQHLPTLNEQDDKGAQTATSTQPQAVSSQCVPAQFMPSITHPREAYLLKVFTQTWGPIFDCLDADLTFTKSVPHIALTSSQPLFWAILATSALQLSRISNYPFSAAQYYRMQCSQSILPLLLQSASPEVNEEALLATYVMLRNYDQMTGRCPTCRTHTGKNMRCL